MNKYKALSLLCILASIFIIGAGCSAESDLTSTAIQSSNTKDLTNKSISDNSPVNPPIAIQQSAPDRESPKPQPVPPRVESSTQLRTEGLLSRISPSSPYRDTKFYIPASLSLNSECLRLKATTSTASGAYWQHTYEAQCPVLGTLALPTSTNLTAEVRPGQNVNEFLVHFMKNDQPTNIPDLNLYYWGKDPNVGIAVTYLNLNAIYVSFPGYQVTTPSYYYFNGTTWEWLDLYEKVKSTLNSPHETSLELNISDEYLHIYESGFIDQNDTTVDLEKKGIYRQQFILDRQTFKILWSGRAFEQAGA